MADLVEWLTAQLDADEAIARAAKDDLDAHGAFDAAGVRGFHDVDGMCGSEYRHIDTFDPAAVLRTIAAHRAILALCSTVLAPPPPVIGLREERVRAPVPTRWQRDDAEHTLRLLAAIYQDQRPGFDPSWIEERSG